MKVICVEAPPMSRAPKVLVCCAADCVIGWLIRANGRNCLRIQSNKPQLQSSYQWHEKINITGQNAKCGHLKYCCSIAQTRSRTQNSRSGQRSRYFRPAPRPMKITINSKKTVTDMLVVQTVTYREFLNLIIINRRHRNCHQRLSHTVTSSHRYLHQGFLTDSW